VAGFHDCSLSDSVTTSAKPRIPSFVFIRNPLIAVS
jgi:hypothetical protein